RAAIVGELFRAEGGHVAQALVHLPGREESREVDDRRVGAHHQGDDEREDQQRDPHQRTSVTPSNMSAGRLMPEARRRSQTFGRTPVALKRPMTLPSWVTPSFSNVKISCMVMISPSMPVISETLVTLRVPSLSRVCCTTIWIADAICWRIARS